MKNLRKEIAQSEIDSRAVEQLLHIHNEKLTLLEEIDRDEVNMKALLEEGTPESLQKLSAILSKYLSK